MQSPLSFIILDEIERLLEYVAIGPRFSNTVLQTILVLLKKTPPEGRRLCVLGTSSLGLVMQDMDISSTFNVEIHVPQLSKFEMKEVLHQQRAFSPAQVGPCMNEYSEKEKSVISQVHVLSDAITYLITLYAYHLTAA